MSLIFLALFNPLLNMNPNNEALAEDATHLTDPKIQSRLRKV
jgi:hypothetical protein